MGESLEELKKRPVFDCAMNIYFLWSPILFGIAGIIVSENLLEFL